MIVLKDFLVKYLGAKPARGLWGIKHTRKPVDDLVGLARGLGAGAALPYLQLSVSQRGVLVSQHKTNTCPTQDCGLYPIDTISYGVQDLVYTRVFAMIVVKVCADTDPFILFDNLYVRARQVKRTPIRFSVWLSSATPGRQLAGSHSPWQRPSK